MVMARGFTAESAVLFVTGIGVSFMRELAIPLLETAAADDNNANLFTKALRFMVWKI